MTSYIHTLAPGWWQPKCESPAPGNLAGDAEVVDWSTGEICEKVDSTVEVERIKVEHILKNGGIVVAMACTFGFRYTCS